VTALEAASLPDLTRALNCNVRTKMIQHTRPNTTKLNDDCVPETTSESELSALWAVQDAAQSPDTAHADIERAKVQTLKGNRERTKEADSASYLLTAASESFAATTSAFSAVASSASQAVTAAVRSALPPATAPVLAPSLSIAPSTPSLESKKSYADLLGDAKDILRAEIAQLRGALAEVEASDEAAEVMELAPATMADTVSATNGVALPPSRASPVHLEPPAEQATNNQRGASLEATLEEAAAMHRAIYPTVEMADVGEMPTSTTVTMTTMTTTVNKSTPGLPVQRFMGVHAVPAVAHGEPLALSPPTSLAMACQDALTVYEHADEILPSQTYGATSFVRCPATPQIASASHGCGLQPGERSILNLGSTPPAKRGRDEFLARLGEAEVRDAIKADLITGSLSMSSPRPALRNPHSESREDKVASADAMSKAAADAAEEARMAYEMQRVFPSSPQQASFSRTDAELVSRQARKARECGMCGLCGMCTLPRPDAKSIVGQEPRLPLAPPRQPMSSDEYVRRERRAKAAQGQMLESQPTRAHKLESQPTRAYKHGHSRSSKASRSGMSPSRSVMHK